MSTQIFSSLIRDDLVERGCFLKFFDSAGIHCCTWLYVLYIHTIRTTSFGNGSALCHQFHITAATVERKASRCSTHDPSGESYAVLHPYSGRYGSIPSL